jgi:hypothetical protein
MKSKHFVFALLSFFLPAFLASAIAQTAPCNFANFDVPNATATSVFGITTAGTLAGSFNDANGTEHGFVYKNGSFTTIDFPGSVSTEIRGMNNNEAIVGRYIDSVQFHVHGFLLMEGQFTTIEFPGASQTYADGINDQGSIEGFYSDANGQHGFALTAGDYASFDFPGATRTIGTGINNGGVIVGEYNNSSGGAHAFLLRRGQFTTVDLPVGNPHALNITNSGSIVGNYFTDSGHGFIWHEGIFQTVDYPGAFSTIPFALSSDGTLVGSYVDGNTFQNHGFVATGCTT